MKNSRIQLFATAVCGVIALGLAQKAHAGNLVVNGGFESTTAGAGQLGFNTEATGWSVPALNNSYTFLYTPGSADTTGANGEYGNVGLWGPGNGVANGLPATSPAGGNYVALDSDFQMGALSQTITGLTAGKNYNVSFYWAAAQQSGFTGPTADNLMVSLGAQSQTTSTFDLPNQGFSGWMQQSFSYTATGPSEVLSFLAGGQPQGAPPFALLDGVSLQQTTVPDATSTAVIFGLSALAMGFAASLYRRQCRQ